MEGSGAGCVLIDPKKNKHFLSCRLEFECTNNTAEYEALVQGLRKVIELKTTSETKSTILQSISSAVKIEGDRAMCLVYR